MSERVNIQYSIELDDLGSEVHRIYKKAQAIVACIELSDSTETDVLSSEILSDIERTRLQLVSLDSTLKDVEHIVSSYMRYKFAPTENFEANEADDVNSDTTEVTE